MARMAQRFGKSPALDYLQVSDPMLALLVDDALDQALIAEEYAAGQRASARRRSGVKGNIEPGLRYEDPADVLRAERQRRGLIH